MSLTIQEKSVLIKLYPQVVVMREDTAYDANGNQVAYDLQAVTAQAHTDAQTIIDARTSALAKLTALGLTQAEVTALVG
jgi:hypothetical protein